LISVIKRYVLPLMLNTVKLPTASAFEYIACTSTKLSHWALLTTRYQENNTSQESACFSQKARSIFRLITCTRRNLYCSHILISRTCRQGFLVALHIKAVLLFHSTAGWGPNRKILYWSQSPRRKSQWCRPRKCQPQTGRFKLSSCR
jgi:hypothetical protein